MNGHLFFIPETWLTPNTYGPSFSEIPEAPGIYLFASEDVDVGKCFRVIQYVGFSRNLARRCGGSHPIKRLLQQKFDQVATYFRLYDSELRAHEKHFIEQFDPPYNIIGKLRGYMNPMF